MRNLLFFHGSCGHNTVEEVTEATFTTFAKKNRTRTGNRTRMVYVWPCRYVICIDCMLSDDEETLEE